MREEIRSIRDARDKLRPRIDDIKKVGPKPQTLNPKPYTLNPKPQTPNPKPQTLTDIKKDARKLDDEEKQLKQSNANLQVHQTLNPKP